MSPAFKVHKRLPQCFRVLIRSMQYSLFCFPENGIRHKKWHENISYVVFFLPNHLNLTVMSKSRILMIFFQGSWVNTVYSFSLRELWEISTVSLNKALANGNNCANRTDQFFFIWLIFHFLKSEYLGPYREIFREKMRYFQVLTVVYISSKRL